MRSSVGVLVGVALLVGTVGGCGGSDDTSEKAPAIAPDQTIAQPPVLTPQEKAEARVKRKAAAAAEAARLKKQRTLAAERRAKAAKEQREKVKRMEAQEKARGGWSGVDGDNYEIAKASCGAFPKEQLASEYGLSSSADEFEIAEAYSHEFVGRFQQANFEGCLAGMGIE
ncbi:MAG TPA: hypothetical protein VLK37_01695 [Solirubrobacterales bacterium]|nr:hypothetical protein [Solirubrobacterales bacterium]